ncbi:hypothetical protein CISG_09416 [Coccidioides immitis RMSCC 3703]|uniref:Uncharacterized protein n=1 Tax=Coccidioides immitis RMSCC 3703 TaxID=454286 RepID=A0A0J8RA34_COCIT|nr:hypothetical protein CISG_09416 [Coccidioides immitis RMSCC 3703]
MPHTSSTSANMPLFTKSLQQLAPPLLSPHIVNPSDTADLLYEYFPLGLDDWQAPVDAVYRPHVVHHMNLPDDPKAIAARNRSKSRLFMSSFPRGVLSSHAVLILV